MASDTTYEVFQHYGTNAERTAFTPSPAAGIQPIYIWYETDTGNSFLYDTSWHSIAGPSGSIPTTVQGDTLYASAANTLSALAKDTNATRYLSNTGATNNPAWAQVALTTGVSGVLPVANGGTGVSAAFSPLLLATGNVANAALITLPGTPVTLITAPGAGFRIKVHACTFYTSFVGGAYTGVDTASASLTLETASGDWLVSPLLNDNSATLADLTAFVGATARTWDLLAPSVFPNAAGGWMQYSITVPTTNVDNSIVRLRLDNNGSVTNLGAGNGANVMRYRIYYTIEATT